MLGLPMMLADNYTKYNSVKQKSRSYVATAPLPIQLFLDQGFYDLAGDLLINNANKPDLASLVFSQ